MKTNASDTSIENYHANIKDKLEESEDEKILAYLQGKQATGRMISKALGIDNSNIARSLNNLCTKKELIEVSKRDKCPITKVRVKWYKIKRFDFGSIDTSRANRFLEQMEMFD